MGNPNAMPDGSILPPCNLICFVLRGMPVSTLHRSVPLFGFSFFFSFLIYPWIFTRWMEILIELYKLLLISRSISCIM